MSDSLHWSVHSSHSCCQCPWIELSDALFSKWNPLRKLYPPCLRDQAHHQPKSPMQDRVNQWLIGMWYKGQPAPYLKLESILGCNLSSRSSLWDQKWISNSFLSPLPRLPSLSHFPLLLIALTYNHLNRNPCLRFCFQGNGLKEASLNSHLLQTLRMSYCG